MASDDHSITDDGAPILQVEQHHKHTMITNSMPTKRRSACIRRVDEQQPAWILLSVDSDHGDISYQSQLAQLKCSFLPMRKTRVQMSANNQALWKQAEATIMIETTKLSRLCRPTARTDRPGCSVVVMVNWTFKRFLQRFSAHAANST